VTTAVAEPVIEVGATPDAFEDNEKLNKFFLTIPDYLSVFHWDHGMSYRDIRTSRFTWTTWNTITFRMWTVKDSAPISPIRYDPRMPDSPTPLRQRQYRMQDFIRNNPWFRRYVLDAEHEISDWMRVNKVPNDQLDVATRWTAEGVVVIKLIDKRVMYTDNTMDTHKKYG